MPAVDTYNLLASVQPGDVIRDPFPHIVVRNPLPEDVARLLTAQFPPDEVMIAASPGAPIGSNKRFNIYAKDVAESPRISPLWKDFIAEQSSPRFLQHALRLFEPYVRQFHPGLINRLGDSFEHARPGTRFRETYATHNVLLDAGISINTPVTTIPTSVRMAHLDLPTKLFTGLYYLRPPEDRDTRGGELVLCRYRKDASKRFWRYEVEPSCVQEVKTIPYENNVLVVFLNSLDSLHAVTPRLRTRHTRKFVNLVVELEHPLFDGAPYQVPLLPYKTRYYMRQIFSWLRVR